MDPPLQWLFPEGEWRSAHQLPILGTLQFWIVSEQLFTFLSSPSIWGQARVDVISSSGQKISDEIVPMAVLITNGVEEGSLGMMVTFCHYAQAKVGSLEVISTLCQWESPKQSMVVVRIFTNSPNLLWGSFSLPYLDVTTLPESTLATQFPLELLCLWWLLPTPKHTLSCCMKRKAKTKAYPIL